MTAPTTAQAFASWVEVNAERKLTSPQIAELAREIASTGATLGDLQDAWLEVARHRRVTLDAVRALVRERCAANAGADGQDHGEAARRAQRSAYVAWWASLSADERDFRTQVALLDGQSDQAGPIRRVVSVEGLDVRLDVCGHVLRVHGRALGLVETTARCWACGPSVALGEGVERWAEIQRTGRKPAIERREAGMDEHRARLLEAYAAIAPRRESA